MNDTGFYQKTVREINLKDMLFSLLLKWRMVFIWAIVTAVLLGGFSYIKAKPDTNSIKKETISPLIADLQKQEDDLLLYNKKIADLSIDDLTKSWSDSKWIDLKAIQDADHLIEEQQNFNDNALCMQINPEDTYKLTLVYYIDNHYKYDNNGINSNNNLSSIMYSYQKMSINNDINKAIADKIGTKSGYVNDLLTYTIDANIITITLVLDKEESAKKSITVIKQLMADYHDMACKKIGQHDLTLLEEKINSGLDSDINTMQINNQNKLLSYRNQKVTLFTSVNPEVLSYYKYLTKELNSTSALSEMINARITETNAKIDAIKNQINTLNTQSVVGESTAEVIMSHSVSLEYIIAGLFIGFFLAMCVGALQYILSRKLHINDEVSSYYHIPLLGTIYKDATKKRLFSSVDRCLIKLKDHNQKTFAAEESMKIIATRIKLAVEKRGIHSAYITGANMDKQEMIFAEELEKALNKYGVKVLYGKNLIYDPNTMEAATKIGTVILMETIGASLYSDIEEEIRFCQQNDMKILGAVVVNKAF